MNYEDLEDLELYNIMQNQTQNSTWGHEYLVRGAILSCDKGTDNCGVNLPNDHGKYILGRPVLSAEDNKKCNIEGFGVCSSTDKKCVPIINGQWIETNNNQQVFDHNAMKSVGIPTTKSYLTCSNEGLGTIKVIDSGQPDNQSKSIPSGFIPEFYEDDIVIMAINKSWMRFKPVRSGHYNINLRGEIPITNILVYKAGLFGNMSLICDIERQDFCASKCRNVKRCYGCVELWLDAHKTYYIMLKGMYDETHNIIIEGNFDSEECVNEIGSIWSPIGRIPGSTYNILGKTYWSRLLTTSMYTLLFDPDEEEGKFRKKRDKAYDNINALATGIVTESTLASKVSGILASKLAGIFKASELTKVGTIIAGAYSGNILSKLSIDLSELERSNIREKGNIERVDNNGIDALVASNGIVLTAQHVNTDLHTTIETWDNNLIEGEKYYRGITKNIDKGENGLFLRNLL